MVTLPFQTVRLSFYVVLSTILAREIDKNSDILLFAIVFQVKVQHKTINLLFCVVFASIKLPRHDIPKNNYRLNDTIIFFVIMLCRFMSLVKKSVTADPYCIGLKNNVQNTLKFITQISNPACFGKKNFRV